MKYSAAHQTLTNSPQFQDWKKQNPSAYLSHFYCQLNPQFQPSSPWEIGFYHPDTDQITVFLITETSVQLKPEDQPFKKEGRVDELDLEKVKVDFSEVLKVFKKVKAENYSAEVLLNGFLILQKFQDKLMWNLSYATKSMQILNLKLNAENKETISHQLLSFIEKAAS